MLLSIIICSRDRADEIANCLPDIISQARKFSDVEVLVVDNGSTDDTKQVVESISGESVCPFRYVYEPIAGLCQARNRGRAEAKGKILAYIDDDARIADDWVQQVRRNFLEQTTDCLTGRVAVEIEGDADFEITEDMLWFFGKREFGDETQEMFYPSHPIGCNMAFRAEVFDAVGGFNTNLKLYGDETDFFRRAAEKKFKMLYDPQVEIKQVIPANRLVKEELRHKSYLWGKGSATVWLLSSSGALTRIGKIAEYFFRTVYLAASSLVRSGFGKFFTLWYNCGYLVQLIKGLEKRS